MPTRPPRLRPVTQRHTTAYARYDRMRGTSTERGYDAHHRRWRKAVLQRDPCCVLCRARGITRPATIADHITPIAVDPSRRLDVSNGRGLCDTHHQAVTKNFELTGVNELPTDDMEHATLTQPMERRAAIVAVDHVRGEGDRDVEGLAHRNPASPTFEPSAG